MNAARTLIRGIAALIVLALLTVGVPWLLLRISGSPIPDTIPTWDQISTALTSRDDGTLLLGLLKYAAWAGWALFAASLVADLVARARGISVPRLGPQQHLASGLVSAVVAIAVTLPAASAAAVAAPAEGPTQTISTTTARDAPHAEQGVSWRVALASAPAQAARPASARTDHQAARFTHYTVRKGDCLWDIAWNELGDPERWPELWEASRHLRQPGGQRITDADHIEPGWTILIPAPRSAEATGSKPAHRPEPSRSAPLITTPLDLPAGVPGRTSGARPAVVTPLNLTSAGADQVHPALARALDRWAAAVSRHDRQPGQREAWRSRIGARD